MTKMSSEYKEVILIKGVERDDVVSIQRGAWYNIDQTCEYDVFNIEDDLIIRDTYYMVTFLDGNIEFYKIADVTIVTSRLDQ